MDIPPPPSSTPPPAPPPGVPTFPTPPHPTDAPPPPYGFGPGAPPPPPYYPGGPMPPGPVKRSGLAIAALVLGIVGLVTCFIAVPSLLALIFGLVAARSIKRSGLAATPGSGLSMARAGWILGLVGVLLFGLFVTLAATGVLDDDDDDVTVDSLEVGDCVDFDGQQDETVVYQFPRVDCDEPHDGEVYLVGQLADGPFPGVDELAAQVEALCIGDAFEEYVGTIYDNSELYAYSLYPLEKNWRFDHEYTCVAYLEGDQLTSSVEGSRR